MYEIMSADEAIRLIRDGDCICVNSFVGIESPIELHEAIFRRYQKMQSPSHLTMVSSAGFGAWDEERCAEGYIKAGAVDRLICGHFGAMLSTKKLVLQDRFEAYNLPLGCISHAIRAQASGLPGALSKVGLDIFVDPRNEGPGINQLSIDDSLVSVVEVEGEEFLYYKLPKLTVALIKGTSADRKGNITFDDQYMSGDALSICQAVKANNGKVIVQVDRLSDVPSRPRNAVIPGCLVDALVVVEPEERPDAYVALTGSFEIPYKEWSEWNDKIVASSSQTKNNNPARIIGRRAVKELRVDDIVNIGIGLPEAVSRYARKTGILDKITLTVESGGIGGFPVSGLRQRRPRHLLHGRLRSRQGGQRQRPPRSRRVRRYRRVRQHHCQDAHRRLLHDLQHEGPESRLREGCRHHREGRFHSEIRRQGPQRQLLREARHPQRPESPVRHGARCLPPDPERTPTHRSLPGYR